MTAPDDLIRQLGELASALGPAVRPVGSDELLRSLTDTARRLFGAAACSLALLTDDESELVYTTAAGQGAQDVTGMRIPAGQGLAGWVVQSGQPIAVNDVQQDPRFSRDTAERTGYVPRSVVAVPVQTPRQMLGVLTLLDRDTSRPGAEHDLTMLSLFADQAGLALESMSAFSDLGRVLLTALAGGVADGSEDLEAALRAAADRLPRPDRDLAALAAEFSRLARSGAAERRLAFAVLREVAGFAEGRSSRTR